MLNEVILACKTYDIMRYYHVKEMSLSYDCVLVVSLNRVSPVSRTKYFVCQTCETRVSVQGVKSLGGHFACLCRGLNLMK